MILKPTRVGLTTNRFWRGWHPGIFKIERDKIVLALMRSLLILMVLTHLEHLAQMSFTQQDQVVQGPLSSRTNRSAYALHIGDCAGVLITVIPEQRNTGSSGMNAPSRSCMR
jgi:hypothetical protein